MKSLFPITILAAIAAANPFAQAGDWGTPKEIAVEPKNCLDVPWDSHRPDSHAPIGVMGDHTHEQGELMLSYRYMYMDMRPNYVGTDEVSAQEARARGFLIMPTNMQMDMHMLGAMYGYSNDVTLGFMLPYINKYMSHQLANGAVFDTSTHGIGDFKFGGLVDIWEKGSQKTHLNLMVSAPTGSITESDFVPPAGGVIRVPYPMQIGSGTWDFQPGITYLGQCNDLSWGAQLNGVIRIGENDEGYSFGDEIHGTAWVAYQLCDSLSTSLRVAGKSWGDVDGRDPLIGGPVPTARPDLRGGSSVDLLYGINYYAREGLLQGHRFAVEAGKTVYHNLDGPQLGTDWMITVGWQKAW